MNKTYAEKEIERKEFPKRLRQLIIEGQSLANFADYLGISHANTEGYLRKGQLPGFVLLQHITSRTGVNLHWLITGEGSAKFDNTVAIQPDVANEINGIFNGSNKSFEKNVNDLLRAALEFHKNMNPSD